MSVGSAGSCTIRFASHGESNIIYFCEFSSVRMSLLGNNFFSRSTRKIQFNGTRKSRRKVESFADHFVRSSIYRNMLCVKISWRHFMNKSDSNNLNKVRVRRISRITLTRKKYKGKTRNFAEWQPRQRCHELKIFETLFETFSNGQNCSTEKNLWELLHYSASTQKIPSNGQMRSPGSLSQPQSPIPSEPLQFP